MSETNTDWIKPGALCNCLGEGADTLLIRTVENDRASVYKFKYGVDLTLAEAKEQWQTGFYCWESFHKLHQKFLSNAEKNFNLVDTIGEKKLNSAIRRKIKLVNVPCPDDAEAMLFKYFRIDEEQYLDAGYGVYHGAYLAEKILGADDDLALAIGKIINHLYNNGLDTMFSGHKYDTDKQVALFIESLGIHEKVAEHFAKTLNEWAETMYTQGIRKAMGGG